MSDNKHIVCPSCGATNRIPANRLNDMPNCGKCKSPLFSGNPLELNTGNFAKHIQKNDIPVVVDFWAPWCGPCQMMAPAFAQAADMLEPDIRFAKVNTEAEQMLGAQYGIRSIPTMAIFKNGQEIARQSGVMGANDIANWVRSHI